MGKRKKWGKGKGEVFVCVCVGGNQRSDSCWCEMVEKIHKNKRETEQSSEKG